ISRFVKGWRSSGLALSTTSNECAKLFDAALRQFVSWTDCKQLDGLEKTMEAMQAADNKAVLPRAFALGLEGIGTGIGARTNETFRKALEDLQVDAAKHGNEREKLHAKAVQQFGEGKQSSAAKTWEEVLKKYPTDLMAIKFAHDTYFYLGDAKMIRDSVQAVLPKHKGTEPCYSYLHGMLAFGLEECEQYAEAEKEALKALEANRYDCWATHARAHVLEMEGRFDEGIKFLESTVENWKPGWMLAAHNYWHNGLYYIEKYKNYEVPLTIFDNSKYRTSEICPRAVKSGAMLDIVDAVSMLWRLELEGVNVGDRWQNLPNLKEHVDDHALFFNDIHMSIALQKGRYNDDEAEMRRTLIDFSKIAGDDYDQAKICREVGMAIYDGISQYILGDYNKCAKSMLPIRDRIYTIGGSNAQLCYRDFNANRHKTQ
ncbi:tetratricopeptide repeat protein, partial [Ancylostoma duodenale]